MNKYELANYSKLALYSVLGEQEIKLKGFKNIHELMDFFGNKDYELLSVLSIIKDKTNRVSYIV